jgi:formylglycine-generating enzyme required for sulfatase activity
MQELAIDYHFAIGALPVTQHFYASIMGSNPSHFVGDDRRPVENVTWYDAVEFCNALSTLEGLEPTYTRAYERAVPDLNPKATGYRLPTEAEWVFACMGGQTGDPYPADLPLSAWYKNTARGSTQPVGDLAANGLGIHDMLGNVEEWCQDFFGTRFVPSGPLEHPPRGPRRTRRGGSWVDKAQVVTAESRSSLFPARCDRFTGFRLARSIPN